jgi:hypothetical protein
METKNLKKLAAAATLAVAAVAFGLSANAAPMEKVIIYENFGGQFPSEKDITPLAWPSVYADSGKTNGGWSRRPEQNAVTGTAIPDGVPFPLPMNGIFHIDSIISNRTGGAPAGIALDPSYSAWTKDVNLQNGVKTTLESATTKFRMAGMAAFPTFMSIISYEPVTPDMWKSSNRPDEVGFLYFGKAYKDNSNTDVMPSLTIPHDNIERLKDVTKVEAIISGSRTRNSNALIAIVQKFNEDAELESVDTLTYSVALTPRFVTIPVNAAYARLVFQARGAANNNNITDFATKNSNTEIDGAVSSKYNTNAFGQTSNPGLYLHMLKVYGTVEGEGYSVSVPDGTTVTAATGIAYNGIVSISAPTVNGSSKGFVGWKISGRPDLSEVANPLTLNVTEDLTVAPVYGGDEVEVAVLNESFTDWKQEGSYAADAAQAANGLLLYSQNPNDAAQLTNGLATKTVRVPLRYGFKAPDGSDSVDINLYKCNVMPKNTVRLHNIPGADQWMGYVAFMGPNNDKGYVDVDSLAGISKAEVELSAYDAPNTRRAAAIMVNGRFVRNAMLQTFYAEKVEVPTTTLSGVHFRVGYGNQADGEYFTKTDRTEDPTGSNIINPVGASPAGQSAAAMALHSLKLYAKVAAPSLTYYRLTVPEPENNSGTILIAPKADNTTNDYPEGTKVTLTALQSPGYGFDGWVDESGNSLGTESSITVTMDAAKTVKAIFGQYPSYVKLAVTGSGSVTAQPAEQEISGDTSTFLAGVAVVLTATPDYGFRAVNTSWTVSGQTKTGTQVGLSSKLTLTAAELVKDATITVGVSFEKISTNVKFTVISDTTLGKASFDHDPEAASYTDGSTFVGEFPTGVTINLTPDPAYSYTIDSILYASNHKTFEPSNIVMSKDTAILLKWKKLSYRQLVIIDSDPYGSVEIIDEHKDYSDYERANKYPQDYWVRISLTPEEGYKWLSIGGDSLQYRDVDDTTVEVNMSDSVVTVEPVFGRRNPGVKLMVNENFQSASRWPENPGTVSNVPGAISYLGLAEGWTPIGKSITEILRTLAPYRALASEGGNTVSEGPGIAGKTPATTQNLVYKAAPYVQKIPIADADKGKDSVTITVANFAPCNDCLIKKAVKEENIGMPWLGQVTPGMVSLQNIASEAGKTGRPSKFPFEDGDTVGVLIVDGMAFVEEVTLGYVPSTSNMAPSVYYGLNSDVSVDEEGVIHGDLAALTLIGGLSSKSSNLRPDQGKYGWGSATEGMTMEQRMSINEYDIDITQIVILPGYKDGDYCEVALHDLYIKGSTITLSGPTAVQSLLDSPTSSKFYLLGSTGILKIDVPEQVKAVVLYNEVGACVGVFRGNAADNQISVKGLKPGVYGAHAYTVEGKTYTGGFIKINND